MPNRIIRAVTLLTSCSLFLVTTAVAQEKSAPKVLERTTTSAEAKAALTTALEEVTNIGGGRRFDTKLQAVVAADPNFGLGRAWYANWTSTFTPAQRTEELTRAVKDAANATTAELLFATALRESRAGRNPVARQLLDIVLQLAPDDPDVLWARLLIAADDAEALRIGEDGIKRFPRYAPIYNIYAYRLQDAGRTDDALRTVSKYVELAPNHPNPHDSYAEILQMNGRYDQADAHYVQALAADPTFDEANVGRAEIEVMRGRYAAARPHLAKALTTAATPARKQGLQRQVAATLLYEGKLKDARALTTSIVTEGEANSLNVLPDKRTLAFIAAIDGRTAEAAELYTAGTPPTPFPTLPLVDAVFHALLKHPDEVSRAVAAMETNAAAAPNNVDVQGAAQAARVIDAVVRNDMDAARAAHQRVTGPPYRALSGAFMAGAARKAGDKTLAQTAMLDVEAYKAINANAAFARLIAKRK